jgi:hypothetical protein
MNPLLQAALQNPQEYLNKGPKSEIAEFFKSKFKLVQSIKTIELFELFLDF